MNIRLFRARRWSLALLLVGLLNHEHLLADYAGTVPPSAGFLRLGRDLMRRTSGSGPADQEQACAKSGGDYASHAVAGVVALETDA